MATFNLPDTLTVGVMKKANVPAVEVDLGKCSAAAIQNAVQQGLKYFFDARLSHKAKATGEAAESPQESVEAVLSRLYAPEWVVRQRGEAAEDELSLEDRAYLMALEPRFAKAGVIWRAKKGKEAKDGKPAVPGKEARTVLDVVDELGGTGDDAWEIAAKKVATEWLRGEGTDEDLIPAKIEGSWKKIQGEAKDHLKSLKAKASAAF